MPNRFYTAKPVKKHVFKAEENREYIIVINYEELFAGKTGYIAKDGD